MPFPASVVGRFTSPLVREITPRRALAFAAALGAEEDVFFDDARAGGIVALPFQCVANEWAAVLASRDQWQDSTLTPEESRRGVHAIQDTLFHMPLRTGVTLHTAARTVAVRTSRAGALSVLRLDSVDGAGAPIFTSYNTSIHRGVAVDGADAEIDRAPPLPTPALTDAEEIAIPVARSLPHIYSECADIWNPIHTERAVARAAGLPDIILHGTATWALAGLHVLRRNPDATLTRLHGRFAGMAIPGETITLRLGKRDADGALAFAVVSSSGAPILSDGVATLA